CRKRSGHWVGLRPNPQPPFPGWLLIPVGVGYEGCASSGLTPAAARPSHSARRSAEHFRRPCRARNARGSTPIPAVHCSDGVVVWHYRTMGKNTRRLIERARAFRKEPTCGEEALWAALRGRALGVRFYRQERIGRFIPDFVCKRPRLIVEIDGPCHAEQPERDQERQCLLEAEGYRVERVWAEDVEQHPGEVADRLHAVLAAMRADPNNAPLASERSPSRFARGRADGSAPRSVARKERGARQRG